MRNKIKAPPLHARPESAEPEMNVNRLSRKRLRLPRRFPNQPTVGMSTALAIMYAVMTHWTSSRFMPKVVMIGGRATLIVAPLTTTRNAPSITVAVTHHL